MLKDANDIDFIFPAFSKKTTETTAACEGKGRGSRVPRQDLCKNRGPRRLLALLFSAFEFSFAHGIAKVQLTTMQWSETDSILSEQNYPFFSLLAPP